MNDHPYALTPDIVHIVVWSALPFSPQTGKEERTKIYNQFMQTHFGDIPKERLRWFVNWGALQSVPGLEVSHPPNCTDLAFPHSTEGCRRRLREKNHNADLEFIPIYANRAEHKL